MKTALLGTGFVTAGLVISLAARAYEDEPPANLSDEEKLFATADVGGVKLGMSPDQVRAVLKGHKTMTKYEERTSPTFFFETRSSGVFPRAALSRVDPGFITRQNGICIRNLC